MNKANLIIENMQKIIIGKKDILEKIVIALLVKGHILIEDIPGVGKTQCACALAKSINGEFNRIQFTPDVMASDITGFNMYNNKTNNFEYIKGAVFCNILLGDEINRASAKTQSSLLEVMEERQVTVDSETRKVPDLFMVIATQNPIESKGTTELPEAQIDRFLFKLSLGYPTMEEEKQILDRFSNDNPLKQLESVVTVNDILQMQKEVQNIKVSEEVKNFLLSIIFYTRSTINVHLGASPRASLHLLRASKAYAYLRGRDYVVPEDVINVSEDVLAHRIILSDYNMAKDKTEKDIIKECVNNAIRDNSRVL